MTRWSGTLGTRCRKPDSLFLTLDVCVAFRFRDAVLFHRPALAWVDGFATRCANSRLWLSEEHRFLASCVESLIRRSGSFKPPFVASERHHDPASTSRRQ